MTWIGQQCSILKHIGDPSIVTAGGDIFTMGVKEGLAEVAQHVTPAPEPPIVTVVGSIVDRVATYGANVNGQLQGTLGPFDSLLTTAYSIP